MKLAWTKGKVGRLWSLVLPGHQQVDYPSSNLLPSRSLCLDFVSDLSNNRRSRRHFWLCALRVWWAAKRNFPSGNNNGNNEFDSRLLLTTLLLWMRENGTSAFVKLLRWKFCREKKKSFTLMRKKKLNLPVCGCWSGLWLVTSNDNVAGKVLSGTCVHAVVGFQLVLEAELLPAAVTFVGLLPSVDALVALQRALVPEAAPAELALVRVVPSWKVEETHIYLVSQITFRANSDGYSYPVYP